MVRRAPVVAAFAAAVALMGAGSARADEPLNQYIVHGSQAQLDALAGRGYDVAEGAAAPGQAGIVATPSQAEDLRGDGFSVAPLGQEATGTTKPKSLAVALSDPTWGYDVFRPWNLKPAPCQTTCSGAVDADGKPVSLKAWYDAQAAAHPELVKRVVYGQSVLGQELVAYKVTAGANAIADGTRPGVMFNAAQHAREWISAEVVRREFGYAIEHPEISQDVELWFVPVTNPDGYDYTFQSRATRLWRKNLRDNNNNGTIASGDGIDTNRNFAEKWRYDNEGASDSTSSDTYRGPSPESEPEVAGFHALMARVKPKFQIDYHSYAKLVLYPVGWQVETYGGDTPIFLALGGDDAKPAVEGYDPDVGGELYTTNGEITDTMYLEHGILAWTVELDGGSGGAVGGTTNNTSGMNPGGFVFQDREADVQEVFTRNLPFALDLVKSAPHPDQPVSHLGNTVPDFVVSKFATSYGDPQTVEVNARRALGDVVVNYQVDGGAVRQAATAEFNGGERYGASGGYYHHLRGTLTGFSAGQSVKVWFTGGGKTSESFSFTASANGRGNDVLVLSAEDRPAPAYLSYFTTALADAGIPADVYDVDANGRREADLLGVLEHYRAVIWYTGDDDYVRDAGQTLGVSKMFDDQILAVRDYLNEGGKVVISGQRALQGAWSQYLYNPQGRYPDAVQCATNASSGTDVPPGQIYNCVAVSNDFLQYWLGANARANQATTQAAVSALSFTSASPFTTAFTLNGGDSANNAAFLPRFTPTSSSLPVASFPQFASQATQVVAGSSNAVGVSTKSSILWGFGLESVNGRAKRAELLRQALGSFGVNPYVNARGGASGTVAATLSLALGTAPSLGTFVPGQAKVYESATTATVISTAGDAALSVSDPGHLTNGAFSLPSPLQVTLSKTSWSAPVSNDSVAIGFKQPIGANDGLRTGAYSKTLTFTLSTTAP